MGCGVKRHDIDDSTTGYLPGMTVGSGVNQLPTTAKWSDVRRSKGAPEGRQRLPFEQADAVERLERVIDKAHRLADGDTAKRTALAIARPLLIAALVARDQEGEA